MKIVCVSDTHTAQPTLPDGDVLVHAGDITWRGTDTEVREALKWLSSQPHKHKLLVPGNHDWLFYSNKTRKKGRKLPSAYGVHLLIDASIVIDGVRFYGSPWQPEFHNWAFNLARGKQLADKWAKIPDDTNVLITHSPPYGVHDSAFRYPGTEQVGCLDLKYRIQQLMALKLHVFGHIHEAYGSSVIDGVTYVNASYRDIGNPAFVVDVESSGGDTTFELLPP